MKGSKPVASSDWIELFGIARRRILYLSADQGQSASLLAEFGRHDLTVLGHSDSTVSPRLDGEGGRSLRILDASSVDLAAEVARHDLIVFPVEGFAKVPLDLREVLKVARAHMGEGSMIIMRTRGQSAHWAARAELEMAGFSDVNSLGVHPNHTAPRAYVPLENRLVSVLFRDIYHTSGLVDFLRALPIRAALLFNAGPAMFRFHLIVAKPMG